MSTDAVIGVTVLGLAAILAPALSKDIRAEDVKYVFTALLPLLGTWMGTVLAFYYSKENFEAANKSVQYMVKNVTTADRLKAILASQVWIPIESMEYYTPVGAIEDIKIGEILTFFKEKQVNRAPILTTENQVRFVIHRNTLESYLAQELMKTRNCKSLIYLSVA